MHRNRGVKVCDATERFLFCCVTQKMRGILSEKDSKGVNELSEPVGFASSIFLLPVEMSIPNPPLVLYLKRNAAYRHT